jgi:hypothetical protein
MARPAVTAFGIPKPFEGHIGLIQRNAIRSWRALGYPVILLGNDPGTAEMAQEVGALHLPQVAGNDFGTPMLDSAFALANQHASTDTVAYLNSDIILLDDPGPALVKVGRRGHGFLGVGRRCNLDVTAPIDMAAAGWRRRLRATAQRDGQIDTMAAIDYFFMARGGPLLQLPPFAVGRPAWDGWLIAEALRLGIPVVDLSPRLLAIHQKHGYAHVPQGTGSRWEGPEAQVNRAVAGAQNALLTAANWSALPGDRIVPAQRYRDALELFDEGYRLRSTRRAHALGCYLRSWRLCPQGKHLRALAGWAWRLVWRRGSAAGG